MSKRLQVLFDEAELREIQQIAKAQRMTVAEWVRQVVRAATRHQPIEDTGTKLATIRAAARHTFPTADVEHMLAEVEAGYLGTKPR
jgi:hypothetical protein